MASMIETLEEMSRLLRADGHPKFADRLMEMAATQSGSEFTERITSLDVWGGAGSIVDVSLSDPAERRRFDELIVDLAEALDQLGISTPRTRWVAQTIEDWLIAHPM